MSTCSKAIPLCIPDNCSWDSRNRKLSTDKSKTRTKLVVVKEALDQLQQIKDPVCVVSIAGPCRMGKSYILSKTFKQDCVFPLGHEFDPETMGIWIWIVPEKYKTEKGLEFTMVLLDSEGIDAVTTATKDDNPIFTLTVLLASVLIYNSQSVAKRTDLEKLHFIANLSQKIGSSTDDGSDAVPLEKRHLQLSKTFPFFFWLLRDVSLDLPKDCANIKEFFMKRVFRKDGGPSKGDEAAQEATVTILNCFSGFDAFTLPAPSLDKNVMKMLNDPASEKHINREFLSGVDKLKEILNPKLSPKISNEVEYVTGEALGGLTKRYVDALNKPGAVPNIPSTWDQYVTKKCTDALKDSIKVYEAEMNASLNGKLPCSDNKLSQSHEDALKTSQRTFEKEVRWIKAVTTANYLAELTNDIQDKLKHWESNNNEGSEKFCKQVLKNLDKEYFNPILVRVEQNAPDLTTADIMAAYDSIEQGYREEARGAENVKARVFTEFHPEITAKLNRFVHQLEQLKDYDKKLMEEKMARAEQEQERVRLEKEREKMEQKIRLQEHEIEILQEKHKNDMLQEKLQHEQKISEERERDKNMLMAEVKEQMEKNAKIREQEREKDEQRRNKEREDFEQRLAAKDEETKRVRQEARQNSEALARKLQAERDKNEKIMDRGIFDRIRNKRV